MIILLAMLFSLGVRVYPSSAVEETSQQRIDWIPLSVDQKWSRATYNYDLALMCGIAYAESMGQTPEDFGRFVGGLAALK
jgi:hypothetical protein